MRPYLIHGMKAATVAAVAALVGWRLYDALEDWADRSAVSQAATGGSEWSGFTQYIVADVVGVLCVPLAVWVGLRLLRAKGTHLAVFVAGVTWFVFTLPRLVSSGAGPGIVVLWVVVQATATGAAMAVQNLAGAGLARR